MTQPNLFDDLPPAASSGPYREAAPFARGSATSQAAAKAIESRTERGRQQILKLLLDNPEGMTDQDLGWAMSAAENFIRPRRGELQKLGLIFNSLTTKPTHSGRAASVWVHGNFATEEMRAAVTREDDSDGTGTADG